MNGLRTLTRCLVFALVSAVPWLMAPGPCSDQDDFAPDDGSPAQDDDEDDDGAGDDDTSDDDASDDDASDDDTSDDDTADDDAGDDDGSGSWLIAWTDIQCDDSGGPSDWTYTAQLNYGCDFVWVELDTDGGHPDEIHHLQEGAGYLWTEETWMSGFQCNSTFTVHWIAQDVMSGSDEAWSTWP